MEEPTYWDRFWRRRVSRRRLISGAALTGSGIAAAAVVGCGGDDSGNGNNTQQGSNVNRGADLGAEKIIDARREVEPCPPDMRGGIIRSQGFDPVVLVDTVKLPDDATQLTENAVVAVPPDGTVTVSGLALFTVQLDATPDSATAWLPAARLA